MIGYRLDCVNTKPKQLEMLFAACLCLAVLMLGQSAVFACVDLPLYAEIQHSFTGELGSWLPGNVEVCAGTRVYFRACDASGNYFASEDDLDISTCDNSQATDSVLYYWDFDYPGEPAENSQEQEGVGESPLISEVFDELKVYTVRLDACDVVDECCTDDNAPDHIDPYDMITVTVVAPDIDTDSDNDGAIEAEDDAIEELYPGKYVEISGTPAIVDLAYAPSLVGWQLRLQASNGNIGVYSNIECTTAIDPMPHTYTIGEAIPERVYVKGVSSGSATLSWTYVDPTPARRLHRHGAVHLNCIHSGRGPA